MDQIPCVLFGPDCSFLKCVLFFKDLSRQKAIRDLVPQDIESYLISLTIALLQKQTGSGQPGLQSTGQSGPKQGPSNSVSRQQKLVKVKEEALTWIEAEVCKHGSGAA